MVIMKTYKLKKLKFDPTATLLQCFIPFILIFYIGLAFLVCLFALDYAHYIPEILKPEIKIIVFILYDIPLKMVTIYPFISFIWCLTNLVYCLYKKKNRVIGAVSLIFSSIILHLFYISFQ